jgi:hypothetical protein
MAFNPDTLPSSVRDAFQYGPIAWMLVVQEGIKAGMKDASELADIVFFLHHPERHGRPIDAGETDLIDQWKSFRTLIKPLVPHTPPSGDPWSEKKRHVPIDLFALQYKVKDDGTVDFAYAFAKRWGDGERWVPITSVYDLIKLIKERCSDECYIRSLRLGGHGSTESFRLGNLSVGKNNIDSVADLLEEIVPYFRPGDSLIRLDHCYVGQDRELLKKVARAFGGVAVIAPHDEQGTEEGEPAFEGKATICGPNTCVDVVTPNMRTRDLLEIIHLHIDPVYQQPWSSQ